MTEQVEARVVKVDTSMRTLFLGRSPFTSPSAQTLTAPETCAKLVECENTYDSLVVDIMNIRWDLESWTEVCRVLQESQPGICRLRMSNFGILKSALADDQKASILLQHMGQRIQKLAFQHVDWPDIKTIHQLSGLENVEELSLTCISGTAEAAEALAIGMEELPRLRRLCIESSSVVLKVPTKVSELELFLRLNDDNRTTLIDWFQNAFHANLQSLWLRLTPSTAEPISLTHAETRAFVTALHRMKKSLKKLYIVTPVSFQSAQDFELVLCSLHQMNALEEATFLLRFPPDREMEARMREYLVYTTAINCARKLLPNDTSSYVLLLGCVKDWWHSTLTDSLNAG